MSFSLCFVCKLLLECGLLWSRRVPLQKSISHVLTSGGQQTNILNSVIEGHLQDRLLHKTAPSSFAPFPPKLHSTSAYKQEAGWQFAFSWWMQGATWKWLCWKILFWTRIVKLTVGFVTLLKTNCATAADKLLVKVVVFMVAQFAHLGSCLCSHLSRGWMVLSVMLHKMCGMKG